MTEPTPLKGGNDVNQQPVITKAFRVLIVATKSGDTVFNKTVSRKQRTSIETKILEIVGNDPELYI